MPVGTIRTKERPDRAEGLDRQQFENPNSIERTKTIEQEKEETQKKEKDLAKIREKYGDASATGGDYDI